MYWSPLGGGVSRYLRAKRAWVNERADRWRHSWVVPVASNGAGCDVGGVPLPASGGYRFPLNRRAAARTIAATTPDLIESGDPFRLAWAALDAAQRCGVPAVAFCHGNLAAEARRWFGDVGARASQRYLRRLLGEFDLVLVASHWMCSEIRSLGLDRVALQPLGVDLSRFHPSRRDPAWRRAIGIADGTTVLLYAGRFAREKNLDELCGMVERLGDGYALLAIGGGPRPPHGRRVRVLPYLRSPDTVAQALASADIFVHAGDRETFGLAPLEALACGTPVVMPALGGLADLADGDGALGVSRATAAALADGVRTLQRRDAEELRAAARRRAESFDHRRLFARQFQRYDALCDRASHALDQ